MCNELIGREDGDGFCIPAEKEWKLYLQSLTLLSEDKVNQYLGALAELGLIDKASYENGILSNSGMEERADEYTKRVKRLSEQSPKIVRPEEKRTEKKTEKKKENNTDVSEVYKAYEETFKKEVRVKNSERNQKIKTRLKTFSLEEIKKSFKNASKDAFLCGDNKENKFYANLDYFIRNDANIEKYLDGASGPSLEEEYQIDGKKVSKEEFESYGRSA